ncbi:c-type cytochrome [bacterium]|nr:c-type cytochrome [bacterium]
MNVVHNHQSKPVAGTVRFLVLLLIVFLATLLLSAFQQTNSNQLKTDEGERVFNQVCSTCHQMDPPASMENGKPIAPPMKMILRHYQMKYDSTEALQNALTSWLEAPDKERSALPAMAIEEHGLMPPLTITEEERTAVVQYLVSLLSEEGMEGMNGMQGKMQHDMKGKMDHDMKGMKGAMPQHKKMD